MIIESIAHLKQLERLANKKRADDWRGPTPRFSSTPLMKKLTEFGGNTMPEIKEVPFLKGEELPAPTRVTFLAPHEEIPAEESGIDKDVQQVLIELPNGAKRNWSMNKSAQRMLAGLLGSNSDFWVGKQATLYSLEQNVKGQKRYVIYVQGTGLAMPQDGSVSAPASKGKASK